MFYGWAIVGQALFVNGLSSGPVWSSVGVWVTALEQHFGWSRAQLTGAFSMAQLEGSIIGPLMGYMIDKLGPRRMVLHRPGHNGPGVPAFQPHREHFHLLPLLRTDHAGYSRRNLAALHGRGQSLVRPKARDRHGHRSRGFSLGRTVALAHPGLGCNPPAITAGA